ncbi:DNA primase [Streptomyces sp. NPDC059070]|uniref:DNA primase n=1 Tax=Streptomyces sp. NPDC059070 TaxID=3346713 RepID=UPI0036C0034F
MNNRLAIGLGVGAGYVLGRTKKAKLAFGIGTMVLGKRLKLSPGALAQFAAAQLENNPQFKELGDQLREDMRGVGKAATGALVNRRLDALADRLHDRTVDVRDRMSGVVEDAPGAEKAAAPARKATSAARRSGGRLTSAAGKATGTARGTKQDAEDRTEREEADEPREKDAKETKAQEKPARRGAAPAEKAPARRSQSARSPQRSGAKGGSSRD